MTRDLWSVPREWVGERCFILCGGESLSRQRKHVAGLKGRVIAVKQSVVLRPDADVLFVSGERCAHYMAGLWERFAGRYIVVRGKGMPEMPPEAKLVTRTKDHDHLSPYQTHVGGYDSGTSAIHLAWLFGAKEIILLGYDMMGGRWLNGEIPHDQPFPSEEHFQRHLSCLPALAADAKAKGIRIVNTSPTTRATWFERQPLEAFL